MNIQYYTRHPLSAAFPSMDAEEFAALVKDIDLHGQREPIVLYEEQVLDGWHRHEACRKIGREPMCLDFKGDDPVAFVLGQNLYRRHLSGSQRAAAAVACAAWAPAHRPNKGEVTSPLLKTTAQMATEAKVSERTIEHAKAAHKAGLGDAVKDGALTAEEAAKIARGTTDKPKKRAESAPPAGNVATSPAEPASKSQAQQDADRAADDAHGDVDTIAMLEELQADNKALQDQLAAAMADDARAEAAKWQQLTQVARQRQNELMATVNEREQQIVRLQRTLRRIGAAVGENDPTRIAGKVDSSMRRLSELLGPPEKANVDNCSSMDLASTARRADAAMRADHTTAPYKSDAQLPANPVSPTDLEVAASIPAPPALSMAQEAPADVDGPSNGQCVADDVEYF